MARRVRRAARGPLVPETRIGRFAVATREDELAAPALGMRLSAPGTRLARQHRARRPRRLADAQRSAERNPRQFTFDIGVLILAMLVVGGMRTVTGAVVGTVIITAGNETFRQLGDPQRLDIERFPDLFLGGVLLPVMLLRPGGLLGDHDVAGWLRRGGGGSDDGPRSSRCRNDGPLWPTTSKSVSAASPPSPAPTPGRARAGRRADRTERRREDHVVQRPHRPRRGAGDGAPRRPRPRAAARTPSPAPVSPARSRTCACSATCPCGRTWRSPRSWPALPRDGRRSASTRSSPTPASTDWADRQRARSTTATSAGSSSPARPRCRRSSCCSTSRRRA